MENKKVVLKQFHKLLKSELPLGALCDITAFALPLDIEFKQTLLEELEVEVRAEKLLECLEARKRKPKVRATFPPEFSVN